MPSDAGSVEIDRSAIRKKNRSKSEECEEHRLAMHDARDCTPRRSVCDHRLIKPADSFAYECRRLVLGRVRPSRLVDVRQDSLAFMRAELGAGFDVPGGVSGDNRQDDHH